MGRPTLWQRRVLRYGADFGLIVLDDVVQDTGLDIALLCEDCFQRPHTYLELRYVIALMNGVFICAHCYPLARTGRKIHRSQCDALHFRAGQAWCLKESEHPKKALSKPRIRRAGHYCSGSPALR